MGDKKDSPLEKVSPEVPKQIKESIAEAGKSPVAAARTSAVEEKKEVESELPKEVKKAPALDEAVKPAETMVIEAKASGVAPVVASTQASTTVAVANGATGAETKASEPTAATNGKGTENKPT